MKRKNRKKTGFLELKDGTRFSGEIFGMHANAVGEVVFNTGMTGYVESLTDPSYRGQILVMTYPLIGNYGVPKFKKGSAEFESDKIQVRGLVAANYIEEFSHWKAVQSLGDWMREGNICGISGIDTRELTKILRINGTMPGRIIAEGLEETDFEDPNLTDLVSEVTTESITVFDPHTDSNGKNILVIDCGTKRSIVEDLRKRGCRVTLVPYDYNPKEIEYDGIMLSNGPGDPSVCKVTIKNTAALLRGSKPVAGICLGSQIMGIAAGGKTYKLPYGHRGQNQPCRTVGTEQCRITSQNHGYAIDADSLPDEWMVSMRNLNDNTVEGIRHKSKPFFSVQFHPEACPGPVDSADFFDEFVEAVING